MTARSWLGCLSVACLMACSEYGARPKSPAAGGNPWVEVTSEHFKVISDLPTSDADAMSAELEQSFAALEQVIFAHPRAPIEPTTVVLFQDESDFHAFAPDLAAGVFYSGLPNDLESSRYILLHGELSAERRVDLEHELTHDFVERNFGAAPPWLNEGLAEYYSTVAVESGQVFVGRALPHLTFTNDDTSYSAKDAEGSWVTALSLHDVAPPSALLKLDYAAWNRATHVRDPEDEDRRIGVGLYVGAWAFVHMLHDGPDAYTQRYRRFLNAAQTVRVGDAFRATFADISSAELDLDFKRYLLSRQVVVSASAYRNTASTRATGRRALTDAEVHLLWARLSPWQGESLALARADLDQAVAGSPGLPDAHYFRGLFALKIADLAEANQELTTATRLSPDDPRFLLALVALRFEEAKRDPLHEHRAALVEAVEHLAARASSATELRIVAEFFRRQKQLQQAREFAERAVARAPLDALALDTYAAILDDLGEVDGAIEAQRKAIAFFNEGLDSPVLLEHLHNYEAHRRVISAP
jgi:tetratricopeptide (TPR) repeat protein